MTRDQINIRLSNIDRWEDAARRGWFQRPARDLQESPKNFGFGFYGTWNSGLLLIEEPTYRILQSPLTAWWQVMTQCVTHGLDPAMVRDWLDQATGRHYADALLGTALGVEIGPFEFQAHSLPDLFRTKPKVDPVLCITGDPESASADAERMIANVAARLNKRPLTPTPQNDRPLASRHSVEPHESGRLAAISWLCP